MSESNAAPTSRSTDSEKAPASSSASGHFADRWATIGFIVVALQFALIVLLLNRFKLETPAFQSVAYIAFAGFLIHHLLPAAWRLRFFLALSIVSIIYVLGLDRQLWRLDLSLSRAVPLFGIGLILIGICHIPVRFNIRVALLILAGGLLAWLRSNWGTWSGGGLDANWIWPILGSMFMFRLMVYLYDLQHEKGPLQPVRVLSYFFLLPNVCFTLFPVIDYKTFCRGYYNEDALRIYQRGLAWMTRGIIHLLLWRLVYYEFYIDPSRVADGAELAQYIVSNMGLYLRVSGQFHLVIGLLLLFGFNLPETNHRYFLAAGFTDYWRRVNIFWKDFIMKLFYYPAVFRLKAWGATWSVVAATSFAFFVTWFLHSYQTFWVRNSFPVKSQDFIFWGCICALVIVGSLREMKQGRKRSLGRSAISWKENAIVGLRTAGTFFALSTLWSLWSCDSLEQWLALWRMADGQTLLWGGVALAAIFAATMVFECSWRSPQATSGSSPGRIKGAAAASAFPWRQALLTSMVPLALLMLISVQRLHVHLGQGTASFLGNLFETKQNKSDEENMVRGYYEDLMDVGRANPILADAANAQPKDWGMLEKTTVFQEIADYRMYQLAPSSMIVLNGWPLSTNRWGMRDREYELTKPAGSFRIAMLGSSFTMGLNVGDGEPFESLVEERLNRERGGQPHARYEILNFAVNGYNPPQQVVVLEKKVLDFKPDAVVLVVVGQESFFTAQRFAKSLRKGIEPPDEVFREVAREARVDARTPEIAAEKRLMPHWPRLWEWAYQRIAERSRQEGIPVLVVYLPTIDDSNKYAAQMLELARKAGLPAVSLAGVYGKAEPASIKVAPWDGHPNALGHKMIADGLFAALTAETGGLLGPGVTAAGQREQTKQRETARIKGN